VSAIGLRAFTACDCGLALGLGRALRHVARTARAVPPRLRAGRCTPRGGCPRGHPLLVCLGQSSAIESNHRSGDRTGPCSLAPPWALKPVPE
jgi:hypothetical protein